MNGLLLALLAAGLAQAQTTVDQLQVTGQAGVSVTAPQARLDARMSAADAFALKVSSANGNAMLVLDRQGRLGIGLPDPAAIIDATGTANSSDIGLQLRVGNSSSSSSSSQLVFALASSDTMRHSIRSRHAEGQNGFNSLDFYLWRATASPTALGSDLVLSLEGSAALSSGTVHVHPAGTPSAELVVSNGVAMGQGVIRRAKSLNPSSTRLKRDILRLTSEAAAKAYQQVKELRHVRFQYIGDPAKTSRRGLIYEEAPEAIKNGSGGLVVNDRLAAVELALQETHARLDTAERALLTAEAARKEKRP